MVSDERAVLGNIRRWRSWLWFFVLTYIPVIMVVKRATHSELALVPFVIMWVVGVVRYGARAAFSRCPRCGDFFHSTGASPSFFNLLAKKCMHCGLPLKAARVIYPTME
jgi:hypothetical protein